MNHPFKTLRNVKEHRGRGELSAIQSVFGRFGENKIMNIKRFFGAALLTAIGFTGMSAQASTISFAYDGVLLSCPDTGFLPCGTDMFTGDPISGVLEVDMAAVVPNGQIGSGDVVSYSFNFGGGLEFNDGNSIVASSFIGLDDNAEPVAGSIRFEGGSPLPSIGDAAVILNIGSNFWSAQVLVDGELIEIANGVGKITAVPVPGALLLFAPALLGFLGLRRKAA